VRKIFPNFISTRKTVAELKALGILVRVVKWSPNVFVTNKNISSTNIPAKYYNG